MNRLPVLLISLSLTVFFFQSLSAQSHILFSRGEGRLNTGETPDLMMIDPKTGKTSLVMKGSVARRGEGNPAVSPDGKKIIFITYRYGGWKLAIADYNQGKISNVRRFTRRPNYEGEPDWSADGQQVLFSEYNWNTDRSGLFNMNQKTGDVREIPTDAGGVNTPSWALNDQWIVYGSVPNGNADIFLIKADGSNKKNLSKNPSHDIAPSCSPSEDKIVFLSNRTGRIHLYLTNSSGKPAKDLTPNLKSDSFKYDNWQESGSWAYKTSWSPDGKQIVFNTLIGGDIELFVINADGTGLKQLTDNNDSDIYPFWTK